MLMTIKIQLNTLSHLWIYLWLNVFWFIPYRHTKFIIVRDFSIDQSPKAVRTYEGYEFNENSQENDKGRISCMHISLLSYHNRESSGLMQALNEANKNGLLDKYSLINSTGFFGMKISLSFLCDFYPFESTKMENGLWKSFNWIFLPYTTLSLCYSFNFDLNSFFHKKKT